MDDVPGEGRARKSAQRRQHRIDHGLCPNCGKEAAPYYLCYDCRSLASMTRMLNTMARRGIIEKSKQGRFNMWSADKNKSGPEISDFHWSQYLMEMDEGDKRRRPRMGRRPIDLDETLIGIFQEAGKPLTMDEIYRAWGRLRSRRKTESLAGDMTKIIAAQRRREGRAAKRAVRLEAGK